MKNLLLIGIFFGLVGVGYVLEKDKSLAVLSEKERLDPIAEINKNEVVEIHLPKVKIARGKDGPKVLDVDYPASPGKFHDLIEKINQLNALKELKVSDDKIQEFFRHQDHYIFIKTFDQELKIRLGDVSEVTGNFYIQTFKNGKQSLFLAKDMSYVEGFFKNELEANLRKYLALKELAASRPFDFVDDRLFGGADLSRVEKIKVDNKINRWFELDFVENETVPKSPKGIEPLLDKRIFTEMLNKVRFAKFHPAKGNSLNKKLSEIKLLGKGFEKYAELFGELNGNKGLYAVRGDAPGLIFEMEDKGKNLFFENVQSFWNKKPRLGRNPATVKKIEFFLGAAPENMEKFKIQDLETFEVLRTNPKVKITGPKMFNILFNALFGVNGFEQASMVNELTPKEMSARKKELSGTVHMRLFGKTYAFSVIAGEIILLDLKDHLEFRYPSGGALGSLSAKQFFAFE